MMKFYLLTLTLLFLFNCTKQINSGSTSTSDSGTNSTSNSSDNQPSTSTPTTSNGSGSGSGTTTTSGSTTSSGSTTTSGSTTVSPTVSVKTNQLINGYTNTIDMYIPTNATSIVIFLHGGGGHKENSAYDLGFKVDTTTTNYTLVDGAADWLINNKVAFIFPQGLTLPGYSGWTWTNLFMDSGQDDMAFLSALVTSLKADSTHFKNVNKFYLSGHSNGGMMTNRVWCQNPTLFDAYAALSGPPSLHLDPTLTASTLNQPCSPSVVKPYLGIIGDTDTVLQTGGKLSNSYWYLTAVLHLGNPPTFIDSSPANVNDILFFSTRASWMCGASSVSSSVSGQFTNYSACGNNLKEIVINQKTVNGNPDGGDHCLVTLAATCKTTLAGSSGLDYKTTLMNFFTQH